MSLKTLAPLFLLMVGAGGLWVLPAQAFNGPSDALSAPPVGAGTGFQPAAISPEPEVEVAPEEKKKEEEKKCAEAEKDKTQTEAEAKGKSGQAPKPCISVPPTDVKQVADEKPCSPYCTPEASKPAVASAHPFVKPQQVGAFQGPIRLGGQLPTEEVKPPVFNNNPMAKYAAQMPAEAPNITPEQTTTITPQAPRPMQGPQAFSMVGKPKDIVPAFEQIVRGDDPKLDAALAKLTGSKLKPEQITTINKYIDAYNKCQDPMSYCAIVAEAQGVKVDRTALEAALKKTGFETQLGMGKSYSLVKGTGRKDVGYYNHYSPDYVKKFNGKFQSTYDKGAFFSGDEKYLAKGAEVSLLDAADKARIVNNKIAASGKTLGEYNLDMQKAIYALNPRGENAKLESISSNFVNPIKGKHGYVFNYLSNDIIWGGIANSIAQADLDIIDAQATLYAAND